jgi:hypothetical protein
VDPIRPILSPTENVLPVVPPRRIEAVNRRRRDPREEPEERDEAAEDDEQSPPDDEHPHIDISA